EVYKRQALLAKLGGGNAAVGCAVGAAVGGFVGFEKARQGEIAAAEQARNEAVAAFAALPAWQKVRASDVKTKEVVVTDKNTRETKKYQAFESVSLDIPLSAKGTPEHDAAMDKLKTLAQRVADERGSSEIVVALTPVDARARKVAATSGTVQTSKGNTITVSKVADDSVPKGVERITVKAGRLQTEV
ncbi:hypothetical protein DTW89_17285, partial [Acidovorax sp. BoFeN1]|uniref:hypothetical protein n=1 Tax=Acidovorax sp. BoFeN1 TaxID=1231053 RepID=UPI000E08DD4F